MFPHNSLAQTPLLSPVPDQFESGEQRMSSFQKLLVVVPGNKQYLCSDRHSGAVLDFSRLMLLEMKSGLSDFSGCSKCKLMTFIPTWRLIMSECGAPVSVFNRIHK